MRFLLRKSWTRNWVKCVSLPAEVAKPRDTQLCTRCFRGWGTLCAAEELMDVVEGVPWGSSLAAGGNWAFLSWLLFWLRLLEGHWLCVWQSCPWTPGKIQAQAVNWPGQLQCQRVPWAVSALCLHPAFSPSALNCFGQVCSRVGFPDPSCLQRFTVLRSLARCSHSSLLELLCYYLCK